MSLPDNDFLVAAATSLAGILLFITIERKFDVKEELNNLVNPLEANDPTMTKAESETGLKLKENLIKDISEILRRQYIHITTLEAIITLFMFAALLSCISLVVLDIEHIAFRGFQLSRFLYVASLVFLFIRIIVRYKHK